MQNASIFELLLMHMIQAKNVYGSHVPFVDFCVRSLPGLVHGGVFVWVHGLTWVCSLQCG
jgi:hypothetical protein